LWGVLRKRKSWENNNNNDDEMKKRDNIKGVPATRMGQRERVEEREREKELRYIICINRNGV
jgi:hypothetical protein